MSDGTYDPDILEILRAIIYEKNYPLLQGNSPNSKFIAGNRLSFRFSLLQLALVDVGLFFSFVQIADGSIPALDYLYLFLGILNVIVVSLLYLIVHRTNRDMSKEEDGYWYSLYFLYCETCNIGSINREDAVLHKIDNPEHVLRKYNVRVGIFETIKFTDIFREPEMMAIILSPLIILLLSFIFEHILLRELFFLPYTVLIVLYIYRRLRHWRSGGFVNFLKINLIKRMPSASLDIFTMRLITVDIRYLKNEIPNLDKLPSIFSLGSRLTYLVEHYKSDFFNNVTVKGYSALEPGIHPL